MYFYGLVFLFIVETITFIYAIKKDKKISWVILITFYSLRIVSRIAYHIYDDSITEYRQTNAYGVYSLISSLETFVICWVNIIKLYIVIIAKIILFEKNQKLSGKRYKNPLILIAATIFIGIAVRDIFIDIYDNYDNKRDIGKVLSIEEEKLENSYDSMGNNLIEWKYDVEFEKDGKKYISEKASKSKKPEFEVGDRINIIYKKSEYYEAGKLKEKYYLVNPHYNYFKYIGSIVIASILLRIRFKAPKKNVE